MCQSVVIVLQKTLANLDEAKTKPQSHKSHVNSPNGFKTVLYIK